MDNIKSRYNTHLQVLSAAPALHSLIIRDREEVADILEILFHLHGDIRKLILNNCFLGEDSTGLFTNIVDLYPDLEVLSLERCRPLTSTVYCLIPHLKNLSELNLSYCQVVYMYVKPLETHDCIHEACRRTALEIRFIYLGKKEFYCFFKICCIISELFSTK
jgi:hypothetical protein